MSAALDVLSLIVHSPGFVPGLMLGILGGQLITFSVLLALLVRDERRAFRRWDGGL